MKKILFWMAVLPSFCSAQSYFGSASNPADNGTNTAATTAVTPPGSMAAGDLVLLIGQARSTGTAITVSEAGGQSWYPSGLAMSTGSLEVTAYWCRFTGAWSADPSLNFSTTVANTVVMHVIRPSSGSKTWGLDQPPAQNTFASNTVVNNGLGQTSVHSKGVFVLFFATADDNTWGYLAGAPTILGGDQYRNTSSTGQSMMCSHSFFSAIGASPGNSRYEELTNGPDAGAIGTITFYEYTPSNRGIPWYFLSN